MKRRFVVFLLSFFVSFFAFGQPQRFVSLAPNVTEILYALGLGSQVVAVTANCDYPIGQLPKLRVGSFLNPIREKILEAEPTLVLATESTPRPLIAGLMASHIPVEILKTPSLEQFPSTLVQWGARWGASAQRTQSLAHSLKETLLQTHNTISGKSFLLVLNSQPLYSVSPRTWTGEIFRWIGYKNIILDEGLAYPLVSREFLFTHKPDIVFWDPMAGQSSGLSVLFGTIKNQKLPKEVTLPADIFVRPGPRVKEALEFLVNISMSNKIYEN